MQVAPSRARFPNGESIAEMQSRTVAALDEVVARHPRETVVVVSHADPIKSAIAHYTGMHLDLFQRVHVSPGVGHRVRVPPVRRDDGEVQRHRRARRPAAGARSRDRTGSAEPTPRRCIVTRLHRVRSRRRHRAPARSVEPGAAHVRDPGPQGRSACCRCSSRRNRSRCSPSRPSSSSTASREEYPEEPPSALEVDGGAVARGRAAVPGPAHRHRLRPRARARADRAARGRRRRGRRRAAARRPTRAEGRIARLYATRAQIRVMIAQRRRRGRGRPPARARCATSRWTPTGTSARAGTDEPASMQRSPRIGRASCCATARSTCSAACRGRRTRRSS